jgi:succinate-semialdehyde dehydrogenase/glutarate-semialdehyde dehydrogenase
VLLAGGHRLEGEPYGNGFFYAPTVLTDVREEMDVAKEAIFGPVAPVMTFGDEAEVVQRSNATQFGLAPTSTRATSAARSALPRRSNTVWSA